MLEIYEDVRESYDFKFDQAVRKTSNCAVHRMEEAFRLGGPAGVEGNKGDWLVLERQKLSVVPHRHFVQMFTHKHFREHSDRKRIPKILKGEIQTAELLASGRRGRTDIKKQRETATYFIDDKDNLNDRDEAPYVFLTLHCPFSEPNVTTGAYVEDVIDVLVDHLRGSSTKRTARIVEDTVQHLRIAQHIIVSRGAGIVPIPEDKERPPKKPCCGGKE